MLLHVMFHHRHSLIHSEARLLPTLHVRGYLLWYSPGLKYFLRHHHQLSACAKCHATFYCNKDCHAKDWKAHKKICGRPAPTEPKITLDTLVGSNTWEASIDDPQDRLPPLPATLQNFDFTTHSGKEVAVYLLDAYRLRIDDEMVLAGTMRFGILHSPVDVAKPNVPADFNAFLDLAEKRDGLLPAWWLAAGKENRDAVRKRVIEQGSKGPGSWSNLESSVEPEYVMKRYGDEAMVGRLRRLAAKVYGSEIVAVRSMAESNVMRLGENWRHWERNDGC
jgi:splicing suppressor protein 51